MKIALLQNEDIMRYKNSFIFIILLAFAVLPSAAGRVMVNARLDSASMLMGRVNTLLLEVVQDKNVKGEFPIFKNFGERGYVTLLNDTVELRSDIKVDTTEIGSGRIQINYKVPVQVFDSGTYRLPEFVFVTGRDSAFSKSLSLTVRPVKVKADDPISPMTDVAQPEDPSIFDAVPDWLYYWWWAILLVLALVAAGVWAYFRYRNVGAILPKKPQIPPHQVALERLQRLKNRKLWQSGQEKEFYTVLTDILRSYLDARFGIKAMEMTSRQIITKLAEDPSMRENRGRMRQILDMADFVKFAMVRPLPDDNIKAFDNAVEFVESTVPTPTEENEAGATADAASYPTNAKRSSISAKHLLKVADKKKKKNSKGKQRKEGES